MATSKKKPTTASGKETIYVDIDDEITAIIDKVKASNQKIIALVLPKRAAVLQSVVNMKLLKRAAQNAKKNIVLITSETGLLPLAGAAGLHVAKSLQSKPEIPSAPHQGEDESEVAISSDEEPDKPIDKTATIGALAAAPVDDETETIELDDLEPAETAAAITGKPKKQRHLKVPNFERFRLSFALVGLGILLLIGGWIFAATVLPKATVTISTDTTSMVSSFDFTASTSQTELDVDKRIVPAVLQQTEKTDAEKVAATGERDDGTKASGQVTLSVECSPANFGMTIPTGTAVSTGGMNYIMQQSAVLENLGPGCTLIDTVNVLAAENGDKFNIASGQTFKVSGHASVDASNSSAISGGTSDIVKIVTQKDVDDAVTKIKERQTSAATDDLKATLEAQGLLVIEETIKTGQETVTASPKVNEEAAETTVSLKVAYSMLGIKRDDLVAIIAKDIEGEIDPEQQAITDDGIDAAVIGVNNNTDPNQAFLSFRTSVTAGPELNEDAIKEAIRGKKRGDAESYINALPGVSEVEINYSPFWVYSTPNSAKKITIVVEKVE